MTGIAWDVRVVASTASTNADVVAAASRGEPAGLVEVARHQTSGRGRLGRGWVTPPGTALTYSVLLRPAPVPATRWSWLPLLTGCAVVAAVRDVTGVRAGLKWPNDVQVGERKLAGILAERAGDAVVVGVGLNVRMSAAELPTPTATSLAVEGAASVDDESLLDALLRAFAAAYDDWRKADGVVAGARADGYRALCTTLGRAVRVHLPGDAVLDGTAADVTESGALVVRDGSGVRHELAAGDVVHVRPA
ncbi:MAG: biotin--[acetyl-CoA-carboxylase] ligase [Streptosporangiales bacterium]|nr:biotin--[acetyl-CoA-carboxylase] ligase [Streptosporangiales bacterium]MBO0890980.1 biotin--[acetyl-CoA-carboxylase] ligase [Acidothermales bacterium]